MKKIILAVAAVFALTLTAQAQDEGRPAMGQTPNKEEIAQRMTDRMAEQLDLTAEQKEAVLALNIKQMDNIRPQMPPRRAPQGEGVEEGAENAPQTLEARPEGGIDAEAVMQEYMEALKGILTDEQYAKFEEAGKNMNPFAGPRRGGPRGKGPGAPGETMQGPAPSDNVCDKACMKECEGKKEGCKKECEAK